MARTDADVEGYFNDLDSDDTELLIDLVAGLDPLAMVDGKPLYTGDQITLIGRFQQFVVDYPVDDEGTFDVEWLANHDDPVADDNSEDIAGTGETEAEYIARVQQEQNDAMLKAAEGGAGGVPDEAIVVADDYTKTVNTSQNTGWGTIV
jgi:hypothetical protein